MARLIQQKRVDWAAKILRENLPNFGEGDILEIAEEVGLSECFSYSESGKGFSIDMTDLQMFCFANALLAIKEVGS